MKPSPSEQPINPDYLSYKLPHFYSKNKKDPQFASKRYLRIDESFPRKNCPCFVSRPHLPLHHL